jgi:hypothetical protein
LEIKLEKQSVLGESYLSKFKKIVALFKGMSSRINTLRKILRLIKRFILWEVIKTSIGA